ncbi:MAG: DUF4981 domain-containing protein [Clostridiales bacterium]|nr:DUF4981 domain-containing protein [Clostridiales bacterium]
MNFMDYDPYYRTDPRVYAVGRLPAVSDHDTFAGPQEAAAGQSSLSVRLDGRWKFAYAQTPDERPLGFAMPDYDCSGWAEIDVPGHLQLQGYGEPHYVNTQYPWDGHEALRPPETPRRQDPVGCYVTRFRTPESWRGLRVTLTLHGVESACYVWLNGVLLGYAEDGFTPSRFDLTDALLDGENKLAVEVYRYCSASWMEDQDFWRFSGIFRSVELRAEPRAHVEDLFVRATPRDGLRCAMLTGEVKLRLPDEPVLVTAELTDAAGARVDCFAIPAAAETGFARRIDDPRPWSAEQPDLYTLRLTLADGDGRVWEVAQTEVGFRRVEIRDGVMLLNGRRLLLHGVNRHEFSSRAGRVLSEAEMLWDIRTMKRNNINAVRTSHYPNDSLWYRLCDRYGLYVIDEANLESHGTWMKRGKVDPEWAVPADREDWLDACVDRARSVQERDKNHPSVLMWSCGNESYGGSVLYRMAEWLRKRDPSRPVHYEGVYFDRRYPATSDVESRMYPPATEVAAWLETHRDKPYVLCEYCHAMGNSCGGLSDYLALEDMYPQYLGGFIWDFIDQALESALPGGARGLAYGGDFFDQPTDRNFCGDGLVFADRTPSPKLQEVKYQYQPVRIRPDRAGVTLANRGLADSLEGFTLRWRLTRNGERIAAGEVADARVPAGDSRYFPLPLPACDAAGEYALLCELCLNAPTLWAEEGYALMHGQAVIAEVPEAADAPWAVPAAAEATAAEPAPAEPVLAEPAPVKPAPAKPVSAGYAVARGDVNIGAYGEGCEVLFSYEEGGPVSFRRDGCLPVLNHAPRPSLWRAPLDNDVGNGLDVDTALWMAFSALAAGECVRAETAEGRLCVRYRHTLPSLTQAYVQTVYDVLAPGRVRVEATYSGGAGLPDLPAFGLCLRLPSALNNVRYYGLGPEENGIDRQTGAVLGIYQTTAEQNLTPYLKPQFCGNRAGVRWMELTGADSRGLRVRMDGQPLEMTALPYGQAELMTARHRQELPPVAYTYVDIAARRYGVGGDNSWGAPVLPQYRLHGEEPIRFSFILELM